jgi:hypothetical protein
MMEAGIGPRRMSGPSPIDVTPSAQPRPLSASNALPIGSPRAVKAAKKALAILRRAERISDSFAYAWFLKAHCLLHLDEAKARTAFRRTRDLSPAMAPNQRAPSNLLDITDDVGGTLGIDVVDVPEQLSRVSEHSVPGGEFFIDNIHFNTKGHRIVAELLADAVGKLAIMRDGPARDHSADPSPEEIRRRPTGHMRRG